MAIMTSVLRFLFTSTCLLVTQIISFGYRGNSIIKGRANEGLWFLNPTHSSINTLQTFTTFKHSQSDERSMNYYAKET